jgi:hypothetical protein
VKPPEAIASILTLALCSCAASKAKGPFIVPIDSSPRGATVTQAGRGIGITPCSASVTNETSILVLELDGYAPREVDLGTVSNEGVGMDVLLFGPIGLLVAADSWRRINDAPVFVELTTEPAARWERPKPAATETPSSWGSMGPYDQ